MSRFTPYHDELPNDFSDDSDDPDYREESADEDENVPPRFARDRADWVVKYADECAELYRLLKQNGKVLFGDAFMQTGNSTVFAHFLYKYTTPGANSNES